MDHKIKNALEGIAPMGISALNETVLSNQPESRYECPVCLNWLRDPVITTCGHKFCKKCITSWLQNSGHCPIDNINLSMKVDIFPDNYTKREIQEQRMSCPFAAKGCSVKVTPLDLDSHISTCEYNQPEASHQPDITIPCSFKAVGCKETFDNQEDLNNHLHNDILSHMSLLMNAYSEIKIDNDISSASLDAKEQEAMSLWEAPDKNDNQTTTPALNNTSALIRLLYVNHNKPQRKNKQKHNNYKENKKPILNPTGHREDLDQNPPSKEKELLKIYTYNLRSLSSVERLLELTNALQSINCDIIILAEVRRLGCSIEEYQEYIFCYRGKTKGKHGVGFLVKKDLNKIYQISQEYQKE
ncbi:E3 ubiquitin-protein ligase PDZRN3-B-like isoform X2 [Leptidea sinapis]|uniref:E3 ubiquitin-protein ligase PDZRN3-B-like isoform X2 n=1 Tax=Leptidea sinapis TaxID=189913 RepID=UPI0021C4B9BC|nr:E3 ubiquitin-protein ligase PDZRN3-B-like isoform X2 [Leptidea sinapis]